MRKIIAQILIFTAIYMAIFALMRAVMLYNLIEHDIDDWGGGYFCMGLGMICGLLVLYFCLYFYVDFLAIWADLSD